MIGGQTVGKDLKEFTAGWSQLRHRTVVHEERVVLEASCNAFKTQLLVLPDFLAGPVLHDPKV